MIRNLTHRLSALLVVLLPILWVTGETFIAATQAEEAQSQGSDGSAFTNLSSAQLASMLERKDFVFVNVHVPYEGEIEGTDAFIVFDKIAQSLDKLPPDKNAKIVLYCRSGRMSEIAAAELSRLGYTNVSHLAGGMVDWQATGREIVER